MRVPTLGRRLYSLLMFVLVSVLGGVLTAGLFVPAAGIAAETTKSLAGALESLPQELETPPQAEGSRVLMADGSELTNFYDQNRVYVKYNDIAPIMRQAQVAIEDQRFFEHGALDLRGTMRALVRTSSGNTQGGSTLTNQYVKLVLLDDAVAKDDKDALAEAQNRTVARKMLELRYAIALEQKLSKEEILERYLNISYFGDGSYGVESAARHYFGTTAKKLTLPQAAMLAGLVRNPATTDPVRHEKLAVDRRNAVLDQMVKVGVVSAKDAEAAKATKFDQSKVQPHPHRGCTASRYPHLCDYVERSLLTFDSLGKSPTERKNTLYRSGLTIQTMIDPRFQDAAQNAVSNYIVPTDPVIGVMAMIEPGTGLIRAMAQSRPKIGNDLKKGETYWNYGADAALGGAEGYAGGSTFKAFTIAAALEKGISAYRRYNSPQSMWFDDKWFPMCNGNFARGTWGHPVTTGPSGSFNMYDGARVSSNTFFLQLERSAGVCETVTMAQKLGLKRADGADMLTGLRADGKLPNGRTPDAQNRPVSSVVPAFTLGTSEITPLSLATAYATLAARGKRCDPIIIKSVKAKTGKNFQIPDGNCQQVISPVVADRANDVLHGAFRAGGTAAAADIPGYDLAGKTGTDGNGAPSIWTMGYTPNLVGAALITVDKTSKRFKGSRSNTLAGTRIAKGYIQGLSGKEAGARLWKPAMRRALSYLPTERFVRPGQEPNNTPRVNVPSCDNLDLEACKSALEAASFSTDVTRQYSRSVPRGQVISISPRTQARQFSTIEIRVSRGPRGTSSSASASPTATATP